MTEKQLLLLSRVADGELILLKSDALAWRSEEDTTSVDPDELRALHELWREGSIGLHGLFESPLPSDPNRQDRVVEIRDRAVSRLWEYRVFGYPRPEIKPEPPLYADEIMKLCWFRRGGVLTLDEILEDLQGADPSLVKKALHWLVAPSGPLVRLREVPHSRYANRIEPDLYGLRDLQVFYLHGNVWADEDIIRICSGQMWKPEHMRDALSTLEACATRRQNDNFRHGWEEFRTNQSQKMILVLIDDPEKVFPLAPQRFAELIRRGRKLGICFHVRTDDTTFRDLATYGGCDSLRECVTSYSRK